MTCDEVKKPVPNCSSCSDELAANPFLDLRVAYGMLLGEDDFRVLAGNARGKQMLHAAWLHRSGVVWGLAVEHEGDYVLKVQPGLAIDGQGRELSLEATWCLNLREWVGKNNTASNSNGCETWTVHACLEIAFDCCLTSPVPTLADPCDVNRKHDDYSRVVESSKLVLRAGGCRCDLEPYHRTRVLLGIDEVGDCDPAGVEAFAARAMVASAPPEDRARVLLCEFRHMSAMDAADIQPPHLHSGSTERALFPELECDSPVPLACVQIEVTEEDGCIKVNKVCLDTSSRRALLPTRTIQDLLCGLAPAVIGLGGEVDAGGPRVKGDLVYWTNDGLYCTFETTEDVNPHSLRRAVQITSLPPGRSWVDEDIESIRLESPRKVVIEMADRPISGIVRLIVKGTGPTPVFGVDPAVPLAGLVGDPPCAANDGRDAVIMRTNPIHVTEAAE